MALPKLTLNRRFMMDFAAAEAPCFALGLVTVDGHETGFLAVHPDPAIPGEHKNVGGNCYAQGTSSIKGYTTGMEYSGKCVNLVDLAMGPSWPRSRRLDAL